MFSKNPIFQIPPPFYCTLISPWLQTSPQGSSPLRAKRFIVLLKPQNVRLFVASCENLSESKRQKTTLKFLQKEKTLCFWASWKTTVYLVLKYVAVAFAVIAWFWKVSAKLELGSGRSDGHLSHWGDNWRHQRFKCAHTTGVWSNRWSQDYAVKTASELFPLRMCFCCFFEKANFWWAQTKNFLFSIALDLFIKILFLKSSPHKIAITIYLLSILSLGYVKTKSQCGTRLIYINVFFI